jgi:hypothetical protein
MSRKEISRIRNALESRSSGVPGDKEVAFRSGYAARVLQVWHTDERFVGPDGLPCELSTDDGPSGFSSLVKTVGGDVPSGAVRAELLAAGAAEELPDGKLRALKRYFIPGDLGEELVVGFRLIVAPVLNGLAHNASVPKGEAYFQRVSYSDNLPAPRIPVIRGQINETASEFLLSVDKSLGVSEQESADSSAERSRVGIGVFYFEEALESVRRDDENKAAPSLE